MAKSKTQIKGELTAITNEMAETIASGKHVSAAEKKKYVDLKTEYRAASGNREGAEEATVRGLVNKIMKDQGQNVLGSSKGFYRLGKDEVAQKSWAGAYARDTATGTAGVGAETQASGIYRDRIKEKWGSSPYTMSWEAKHSTCVLLQMLVKTTLKQGMRNKGLPGSSEYSMGVGNPRTLTVLGTKNGNYSGSRTKRLNRLSLKSKSFKPYKFITPLKINSTTSFITEMMKIPQTYDFLRIDNEKLSFLVPSVRIFMIEEETLAKQVLKEISFSTTAWSRNADQVVGLTPAFLKNRLNRGNDVGITKLEVKYLATNPAEVNNTIELSLELFFRNAAGLSSVRKDPRTGKSFRYIDLIKRAAQSEDTMSKDIKFVFGWASPTRLNVGNKKFNTNEKQALILQREVMKGYLREHEISYNDDGSCVLSITYNASAEGVLLNNRRSDMLAAPTHVGSIGSSTRKDRADVEQARKSLKKLQKERREVNKQRRRLGDNSKHSKTAGPSKREKDLNKFIENYETQTKLDGYAYLFDRMLDAKAIKTVLIPREFLRPISGQNYSGYGQGAQVKGDFYACNTEKFFRAQRIISRISMEGTTGVGGSTKIADWKTEKKKIDQMKTDVKALATRLLTTDKETNIASHIRKINHNVVTSHRINMAIEKRKASALAKSGAIGGSGLAMLAREGLSGQTVQIPYIHFGDILESAFSIINDHWDGAWDRSNQAAKVPYVLSGPFNMPDPCVAGRIAGTINIADIPIAVTDLNSWLIHRILRISRKTYPIKLFIHDLLTDFLPNVVFSQCSFEGFNLMPRMNFINVRGLPKGKGKETKWVPPHLGGGKLSKYRTSVNLFSQRRAAVPLNANASQMRSFDYMLIYGESYYSSHLHGSIKEDAKRGIWHLTLVADFGPIRSWAFDRNDVPYRAEMNTFEGVTNDEGKADYSGGSQYNVKIKMAGNGLFRPGQMIYLNVDGLGLSTSESGINLSKELFIGGYYFVTEVVSSVTVDSGYETEIRAIWMQHGDMMADDGSFLTRTSKKLNTAGTAALIEGIASAAATGLSKTNSPHPDPISIAEFMRPARTANNYLNTENPVSPNYTSERPIKAHGIFVTTVTEAPDDYTE